VQKHTDVSPTSRTLVWGGVDFEFKTIALAAKRSVYVFDVTSPYVTIYTPYDTAPGFYLYVPVDSLRPRESMSYFDPTICIGLIYNGRDHYNAWLP
jgi:hypothetical protein